MLEQEQCMGYPRGCYTPREPLSELEARVLEVLGHLETIKPGCVSLAEAGSGLAHEVRFSHRRVRTQLTVLCVAGEGIVVKTPLSVYEGPALRTPKVAPAVWDFAGAGPVGDHLLEIIADAYTWAAPGKTKIYECGQGGDCGLMYHLEFVCEGPGPSHKHLRYRCSTVAELACFLDAFLGTYTWDLITG